MANRTTRTDKKVADFLAALCEGASISKACAASGVARRTVYDWRHADKDFASAWDEAVEAGTDVLEDEAVRRAVEGVDEPVFYQGQQCGLVRKYSDTLLMFMLKGRRGEKFRDRHEHSGPGGGPIETSDVGLNELARRLAFVLAQGAAGTKSKP